MKITYPLICGAIPNLGFLKGIVHLLTLKIGSILFKEDILSLLDLMIEYLNDMTIDTIIVAMVLFPLVQDLTHIPDSPLLQPTPSVANKTSSLMPIIEEFTLIQKKI